MRLGIIAGNRNLPILLSKSIKSQNHSVIAICFKGETSSSIKQYVDKSHWIKVGNLTKLKEIIKQEGLNSWIMAGQINPLRIFNQRNWDNELKDLVKRIGDFRPHSIFRGIIDHLEAEGISFLDSTSYLKNNLSTGGIMNNVTLNEQIRADIDFGLKIVPRYVELDVGQVMVVKSASVVALEALEGTDNTIKRGYRIAGKGCSVFKFSKANQDLRFDVPVVGLSTLNLLKRIGAKALVLEKSKVIILEKERFLLQAARYNIPVIGY